MPNDAELLEVLLDAWDRSHRITAALLRAVPEGGLAARALPDSPTVAQLFHHLHYVRLAFVHEDAPEHWPDEPHGEWDAAPEDVEALAGQLDESAAVVRAAVAGRVRAGRATDAHFDHPVLLMQHLMWHDAYHHGQIKLALKAGGKGLDDGVIGPLTWGVWIRKTR